MTASRKIALSLLCTVFVFAVFSVIAILGIFPVIETRYYEPAKVNGIRTQLDDIADTYKNYITSLLNKFGRSEDSYTKNPLIDTYLESSPSDENVRKRTKLTGELFESVPGLMGIRLVDKNGRYIHFSTYKSDIFRKNAQLISYKDYTAAIVDTTGDAEIPYNQVAAPDSLTTNKKDFGLEYDPKGNRVIFSFPVYDTYSVYRGSLLFYVDSSDFNRVLIASHKISLNNIGTLVSSNETKVLDNSQKVHYVSGYVFGLPKVGKESLSKFVISKWIQGYSGPNKVILESPKVTEKSHDSGKILEIKQSDNNFSSNDSLIFISSNRKDFAFISGLYQTSEFLLPTGTRVLLLICLFITLFIILFLIFSAKHDPDVIIRYRIKKLQLKLLSEYFKNKKDTDWNQIFRELSVRKEAVSLEIKKSLGQEGQKNESLIETTLNNSWDEILSVLASKSDKEIEDSVHSPAIQNTEEIKKMLEEILSNEKRKQLTESVSHNVQTVRTEPVEELEDVAEVKPVEELEEIEEVEPVEELEEIEEAEPVEELEEIEEVEPVEELEEIEEAEPVDFQEINKENKQDSELEETLEFGEPESQSEQIEKNEELSSNFNIANLDYSFLDNEMNNKKKPEMNQQENPLIETKTDQDLQKDTNDDNIREVEFLPESQELFTLSHFADNNDDVTDLFPVETKAIEKEQDGTYRISSSLPLNTIHKDEKFRKLVNTVLKRK